MHILSIYIPRSLIAWLLIGLVVYFGYSRRRSHAIQVPQPAE